MLAESGLSVIRRENAVAEQQAVPTASSRPGYRLQSPSHGSCPHPQATAEEGPSGTLSGSGL